MDNQALILSLSAFSIALIHTLMGPDHYIPFIAMSRAGKWNRRKTLWITAASGLGHVFSSVILGLVGISAGMILSELEAAERFRADLAAWLIISFGLLYLIWGIKKIWSRKHVHTHQAEDEGKLTPWIIFTIFVLGPCEPLIPLLIYPSVMESIFVMLLVVAVFASVTTLTMVLLVAAGLYGMEFINLEHLERYTHALAGLMILFCGISIKFMGL